MPSLETKKLKLMKTIAYRLKKIILISFLFLILRYIYCKLIRKVKRLPPGPIGVPIFGSLFSYNNLKKFLLDRIKDGDISLFYFLTYGRPLIMINDAKCAHKLLKHKNCQDRLSILDFRKLSFDYKPDFMLENGNVWLYRRKLFKNHLQSSINLGFFSKNVKNNLRNILFNNIDNCIKNDTLYYPQHDFQYLMFLNIYQNTFGNEYIVSYDEVMEYLDVLNEITISMGSITLILMNYNLPNFLLKYIDKRTNSTKLCYKYFDIQNKWLSKSLGFKINVKNNEIIPERNNVKTNLVNKNDDECVFAEYLMKQHLTNPNVKYLTPISILTDLSLIFAAGTETTSLSMSFILYILGNRLTMQDKLYNEIVSALNSNANHTENKPQDNKLLNKSSSYFQLKDINKLHLVRAFIYECLRISFPATTSVPRLISNSIKYNNYILPKGSMLSVNMMSCNNVQNGNLVNQINLSNWLDGNNKFKKNEDTFISFGAGKRDCAGQSLAMKQLFYFTTNIILNYKIYHDGSKIELNYDFVRQVSPIGIKFEKRSI